MLPTVQAVTITVSNLERSKQFYEKVIGFEPDAYYAPGRWQCYKAEGRAYLGIGEQSDYHCAASKDIINFDVDDLEALWAQVKERCVVETPLQVMPWGTRKFIIHDPDGNRLGFCQRS